MAVIFICSTSYLLRRSLATRLHSQGHEVCEFEDSISLLTTCLKQKVDIILVNSELPVITELGAIRYLRSKEQTEHVTIFALCNDAAKAREVTKAGADHAMLKPVETVQLTTLIDELGATRKVIELLPLDAQQRMTAR